MDRTKTDWLLGVRAPSEKLTKAKFLETIRRWAGVAFSARAFPDEQVVLRVLDDNGKVIASHRFDRPNILSLPAEGRIYSHGGHTNAVRSLGEFLIKQGFCTKEIPAEITAFKESNVWVVTSIAGYKGLSVQELEGIGGWAEQFSKGPFKNEPVILHLLDVSGELCHTSRYPKL